LPLPPPVNAKDHTRCTEPGNRTRGVAQAAPLERSNLWPDDQMTKPVDVRKAPREVRTVFDDIKKTRNVPDVNNFWKHLANDPKLLKRTWESVKETMAPGALDPLVKEMLYLAVSVTNGCGYCIASHGAAARKAGMSEAMFGELMAVVGMANETNRLANGYRVPIDAAFGK
jgi:AhpD family alkylhydroperoxidase